MKTRVIFTTRAQYRMLCRLCRGALLPVNRFRVENPTMGALLDKGLANTSDVLGEPIVWEATALGRRVRAARNGFLAVQEGA